MQKEKKKEKQERKEGKFSWLHWGNIFPILYIFIELFLVKKLWENNEKTSWKYVSNISRTTSATTTKTEPETAVWKCEKSVELIGIIWIICKFPTNCKQYLFGWYLVFELANHDSAFLSRSPFFEILELHKRREEFFLRTNILRPVTAYKKQLRIERANDVKWKTFSNKCVS